MRYISTRGDTPPLDFQDAVLMGLAADGGLLLPESIPSVADDLNQLARLNFSDLALKVFERYATDMSPEALEGLVNRAYASFDHVDITPIVGLGERYVLELFHGPTLAFKDIALQFLGGLFDKLLCTSGQRLKVLAATSGDTGSAAIAGLSGVKNVDLFVLYPKGRISPLQELQMTTVTDSNVHCLSVQGSFDDCQEIVKTLFADEAFKQEQSLGAVNSVNWARILAQIVYYGYASLKLYVLGPVSFTVPSGNFGNIFAGYLAKKMGFPIGDLVLASNANDILPSFFQTGCYRRGTVNHTLAPAMDIQVASNFERYLYYLLREDERALKQAMKQFSESGTLEMDIAVRARSTFKSQSVTDAEILETISRNYHHYGYVLDPHSACGVSAAEKFVSVGPMVCISTAHPAKFPEAVNKAVGKPVATHPSLEKLIGQPTHSTTIAADVEAVKRFVKEN